MMSSCLKQRLSDASPQQYPHLWHRDREWHTTSTMSSCLKQRLSDASPSTISPLWDCERRPLNGILLTNTPWVTRQRHLHDTETVCNTSTTSAWYIECVQHINDICMIQRLCATHYRHLHDTETVCNTSTTSSSMIQTLWVTMIQRLWVTSQRKLPLWYSDCE